MRRNPNRRWRLAAAAMGLAFVVFALLQFNDPDPEIWATAYLIPALVSFARAAGWRVGREAGVLAAVYVVWATLWRPSSGPEQMAYEYEKEVAGLLIAAGWLAALAIAAGPRRSRS